MERIWLKSYRADVPAGVDVDAFSSIVNMAEARNQTSSRPSSSSYGSPRTRLRMWRTPPTSRVHVEQVHEEIIGQRLWPLGDGLLVQRVTSQDCCAGA